MKLKIKTHEIVSSAFFTTVNKSCSEIVINTINKWCNIDSEFSDENHLELIFERDDYKTADSVELTAENENECSILNRLKFVNHSKCQLFYVLLDEEVYLEKY